MKRSVPVTDMLGGSLFVRSGDNVVGVGVRLRGVDGEVEVDARLPERPKTAGANLGAPQRENVPTPPITGTDRRV